MPVEEQIQENKMNIALVQNDIKVIKDSMKSMSDKLDDIYEYHITQKSLSISYTDIHDKVMKLLDALDQRVAKSESYHQMLDEIKDERKRNKRNGSNLKWEVVKYITLALVASFLTALGIHIF